MFVQNAFHAIAIPKNLIAFCKKGTNMRVAHEPIQITGTSDFNVKYFIKLFN